MKDSAKTKAQLLADLNAARQELANLEKALPPLSSPDADPTITVAFIQALAQALDGVVCLFSSDGLLFWWNKNTEAVTGYSPRELAGMEASEFVPAEDQPGARQRFEQAMAAGAAEFDSCLLTRDGRTVPYQFTCQRILFDGNPCLMATGTDATRHAETRAALRRSEARKVAVLEAALDAIIAIDHEECILEFNPAAEKIFGHARSAALGRKLSELIIPVRYREAHLRGLRHYLATGEGPVLGRRVEMPALRADGSEFPAEISIVPTVLDGKPIFTGYLRDITARKQSENEFLQLHRDLEARVTERTADLRAANAALERTAQLRTQFLATVSHELRTPLNGVVGMVELLANTELDERQRRYAQVASASADILRGVIDDILDFARLESGNFTLEARPLNPADVVAEVVSLLSIQAQSKRLELASRIAAEVNVWVSGDRFRLRQVLMNLAANAIKFTERGSVVVTATSMAETAARADAAITLRFTVTDTGIGIATDQMDRLFRPFSQVDSSTTRRFGGSGLGLAICAELTELMGGKIGVESAAGKGSTFWFTVQLPKVCPPSGVSGPATASRPPIRPLHVLVAEDNEANRLVAVTLLEMAGHKVRVVLTGREAVEVFEQGRFDAILMDLQMPEMDGLQATREMRRREPPGQRTRIIGLTAHADRGELERCLAEGMDAYLAKPFHRQEFEKILSDFDANKRGSGDTSSASAKPLGQVPQSVQLGFRLDRAAVLARLEGDEQLLSQLVRIFHEEFPKDFAWLRAALDADDAAAAKFQAHRLLGLARQFDAQEAIAAAERLETLGAERELTDMRSQCDRTEQLFRELGAALQYASPDLEPPKPSQVVGSGL
jgi:PAS domain S-box-containing protein